MKSEYDFYFKDQYTKSLAKKIKYLRNSKTPKVTQEQLAKIIGVARPAVAQWESDVCRNRSMPSLDKLSRVAEYFDVDISFLINEDIEVDSKNNIKKRQDLPIIDYLESVPLDAIHEYEHNKLCKQEIKYGFICKKALEEIKRLQAEIEKLKESNG
jgi:transcriptional regulator with XRE-family HTH domain